MPPYVNKPLYLAAPFVAITMALLSIAVIPFGPQPSRVAGYRTWMQLTDLNIGVLFILATSSIGVYSIAFAGWASNNKYALLGGDAQFRADDQLRVAPGHRHSGAAAALQYFESARTGGHAGRRHLPLERAAWAVFRKSSALSFS